MAIEVVQRGQFYKLTYEVPVPEVSPFKDCGDTDIVYDIVKDNFAGQNIPILAGFQVGHDTENLTIPIGPRGILDTESGMLRFDEPAMRAL